MLEEHICSYLEGRVRLRHQALKNAGLAGQLESLLRTLPGVEKAQVNSRIGSLLLEYDPQKLSREDLQSLLRRGELLLNVSAASKAAQGTACNRAYLRRWTYRAALASLAISTIAGFRGRPRAHVLTGGLFLALNACHLWNVRRAL